MVMGAPIKAGTQALNLLASESALSQHLEQARFTSANEAGKYF
jgi:hypothetical protein